MAQGSSTHTKHLTVFSKAQGSLHAKAPSQGQSEKAKAPRPRAFSGRDSMLVCANSQLFGLTNRASSTTSLKGSHFGSSHFMLEAAIAFAWSVSLCWFFFCILVRRRVMPRRGWMPAPDGWVQIIRGPRPPAERWPKIVRVASTGAPKPWQQIQVQAFVGRWGRARSHVQACLQKSRSRLRRRGLEALKRLSQLSQQWAQSMVQKCKFHKRVFGRPDEQLKNVPSMRSSSQKQRKSSLQAHDAACQQFVQELEESEG